MPQLQAAVARHCCMMQHGAMQWLYNMPAFQVPGFTWCTCSCN